MTDDDFPEFETLFQRLRFVFRIRASTDEFSLLCGTYFKALHKYPLTDVVEAADAWTAQGTYFPRPGDWVKHIPRHDRHAEQLPVATDMEVRLYRHAAMVHWKEPPCLCRACVTAGVSELPVRFVPDLNGDGHVRRLRDPDTQRAFVMGHWLHGEPLGSWYLARENYRDELMARMPPPRRSGRRRVLSLVAKAMSHVTG